MSAREERRKAAEDRRSAWRLRWATMAQKDSHAGMPFPECMKRTAYEANRMMADSPAFKSEILRAFEEFSNNVIAAIKKVKETTQ